MLQCQRQNLTSVWKPSWRQVCDEEEEKVNINYSKNAGHWYPTATYFSIGGDKKYEYTDMDIHKILVGPWKHKRHWMLIENINVAAATQLMINTILATILHANKYIYVWTPFNHDCHTYWIHPLTETFPFCSLWNYFMFFQRIVIVVLYFLNFFMYYKHFIMLHLVREFVCIFSLSISNTYRSYNFQKFVYAPVNQS